MKQIDANELKAWFQQVENKLFLLDVRQPQEYDICNLSKYAETELIPMDKLASQISKIPKDKPVVIYCHHGVRSSYAGMFLEQVGFENLYELKGGIHAWAINVEPGMPVY